MSVAVLTLTYEFTPDTLDEYNTPDPVEWEYDITNDDIEEFLIQEFDPKEFADLLYNSGYLLDSGGDDSPWDYWSEVFEADLHSVEEVRDYISKMSSMADILYRFDLSEQDFEWLVWEDDDLYERMKEFFKERAEENFNQEYEPEDGRFDFEDNGLYYQYKEGPEYWRK